MPNTPPIRNFGKAGLTSCLKNMACILESLPMTTLDCVLGLVPSANPGEHTRLLKLSSAGNIDLDLGYISLCMDEHDAAGEKALRQCILGAHDFQKK